MAGTGRRMAGGAALFAAALVAGVVGTEVGAQSVEGPGCGTALLAFPEAGHINLVDIETLAIGAPIELPGAYKATVSADGTTAWVIGNHATAPVWTLTPVDLASSTVGVPTALPFLPDSGPVSSPVITPDGGSMLIGTSNMVTPIDLDTMQIGSSITYTGSALRNQIAVSPDGSTLFAASSTSFDLQVVDLESGTAGPLVAVGSSPIDVTALPDGSAVYAANYFDGDVSPVVLPSLTTATRLPGLAFNQLIEASADADSVLVASAWSLARVDLGSGLLGPVTTPGGAIESAALLPSGSSALVVTIGPDRVSTVDLTTGAVSSSTALPAGPSDVVAVVPPQAPDARLTASGVDGAGTVGLDASGSTAACGSLVSYTWDFGDGSPVEQTAESSVQHTYSSVGRYEVSVEVTDSRGTSTERVFTGQAVVRNGGPSAQASTVVEVSSVTAGAVVAPSFAG